jgi:hypothetical protein
MSDNKGPIVHHAPGTDPANPLKPIPHVPGPIVHTAPDASTEAAITHGQAVSEVYDALEAESKNRKDAATPAPDEPKDAA